MAAQKVDLAAMMAETTATVREESQATDFVEVGSTAPDMEQAAPVVNDADFDARTPGDALAEEVSELTIEPGEIADLLVSFTELVVDHGFPWLNEMAAFSKDDRAALRAIVRREKMRKQAQTVVYSKDGTPEGYTVHDLELLQRFDECEEYRDNVALTEEESEKLKKHLKAAIKGASLKMSPKAAMYGAFALVLLPRAFPIVGNLFDRYRNKTDEPDATAQ